MRPLVPTIAIALSMFAAPALAQDGVAGEVASAERAFDAFTAEHGFTAGFLEYAAPDGILFRPDPVNAREYLSARPASTDTQLRWGPARVGVAASGDLAWDTGPWSHGDQAHGWFFTIWVRQPDGAWRWALDHGAGSTPDHRDLPVPGAVIVDPTVRGVAEPGADGWAEIQAADAALNGRLESSGPDFSYNGLLTDDAWVNTPDAGPAMTAAAIQAALEARPFYDGFEPIGGGVSQASDLAWTYGHARWTDDAGAAQRGHYIRIWRRDGGGPQGWRIVYDQLSPVPAA